jgi:hypothetical protein
MHVTNTKRHTREETCCPQEKPAARPKPVRVERRQVPIQWPFQPGTRHRAKLILRGSLAVLAAGALFLPEIGRADEADYVTTNLLTVAGGNFSNQDDAYTADINIGFTFTMGGTGYTKVKMSSNGILFFTGPTAAYNNTPLSSMLGSVGVYPLWDDLYVGTPGNESLSRALYYSEGTPGSRVFIIQWGNWYSYNEPYEVGTWNVVLYEGSNKIDIYYRNMLGTSVQRGYGASATIGIVANGSYYSQYSYDSPVATQGLLLTYSPSAGGNSPYTLAANMVTAATTASLSTYYLAYTNAPKVAVNLSAAPNPATSSATLSWDLDSQGQTPTAYNIRYALNAQMANLIQTAAFSCTNVNQYGLSNLLAGSNYYWQVVSTIGTLTSVSTISSFVEFVNHPPVATGGSFSTLQHTPYSGFMTATDVDNTPDTSGLIYSVTTPPSSGTVVINNSATGAFTYTPTTGFSGSDSFIFKSLFEKSFFLSRDV